MTPLVAVQARQDEVRLCCPNCRREIATNAPADGCPDCGHIISRIAEGLTNFLPVEESVARAALAWPPQFVRSLENWVGDDVKAVPLDAGFRRQLASYDLVGPDGELTSLGASIRYHVLESRWQAACEDRDGLPRLMTGRPSVRVLDVGCGAAQTLRLLATAENAKLVGIDTDLVAIALGLRFAQLEGVSIRLAGAAADSLPFRDESFDLVLCRVALNYMHQRAVLAEMARVLALDGHMYLRVERIWHDAYLIARSRSACALACRCRDLGHGVVHALAGWQVAPGGRIRGGRSFASARRVEHMLRPLGCRIVSVEETPSCPQILGRRTQLTIVARRESMGSQADVARG